MKVNQTGAGVHADSRREVREARGASARRALADQLDQGEFAATGDYWTVGLCVCGDEEPWSRSESRCLWSNVIPGGGERYLGADGEVLVSA